jgi:hypothetical protein
MRIGYQSPINNPCCTCKKHFHSASRQRYVNFNQGVDARLFTEKKVELLSKINVRPLRIAFDDMKTQSQYEKVIRMSAAAGMRDFSNYLLYNFRDKPIDLYLRKLYNVNSQIHKASS